MKHFTDVLAAAVLLVFFVFTPAQAHAARKSGPNVMVSSGVKAELKADTSKGMVDLYLTDAATKKPIEDARVAAAVTLPDGRKVENGLAGMAMGERFSYMAAIDMGISGTYVFDIRVEAGAKNLRFSFKVQN